MMLNQKDSEDRFELDDDFCIMDNEHFFIRRCIKIPIIGIDEYLIWEIVVIRSIYLVVRNFENRFLVSLIVIFRRLAINYQEKPISYY